MARLNLKTCVLQLPLKFYEKFIASRRANPPEPPSRGNLSKTYRKCTSHGRNTKRDVKYQNWPVNKFETEQSRYVYWSVQSSRSRTGSINNFNRRSKSVIGGREVNEV